MLECCSKYIGGSNPSPATKLSRRRAARSRSGSGRFLFGRLVRVRVTVGEHQRLWNEAVKAGEVIPVGKSLEDNWQSTFIIPGYVADANPGLVSVETSPPASQGQIGAREGRRGDCNRRNVIPDD